MEKEVKIDKSITDQIIDKMIVKLKDTGLFSDEVLAELNQVDLSNTEKIKQLLSEKSHEATETRD